MSQALKLEADAAALTLRSMRSPQHRSDGWGWTDEMTCLATNWAYCTGAPDANTKQADCFVSCALPSQHVTQRADTGGLSPRAWRHLLFSGPMQATIVSAAGRR